MTQGESEAEGTGRPTVRDKRRIDPETYELRDPEAAAPAPGQGSENPAGAGQGADTPAGGDADGQAQEIAQLKQQVSDRTSDLQRVQAEYVNYKRRVDRDRDLARKSGIEIVLRDLLPIMDSLKAAREHEELTGGFKAVAEEIERLAAKHGLESFGEAGDPFDPRIHEALMHAHADGITGPTCVTILQLGYKMGDRILRPARVAVAEPDESAPAAESTAEPAAGDGAAEADTAEAGPAQAGEDSGSNPQQ